jgi:hypothetical protein
MNQAQKQTDKNSRSQIVNRAGCLILYPCYPFAMNSSEWDISDNPIARTAKPFSQLLHAAIFIFSIFFKTRTGPKPNCL